jgi:hypothetical protein
MRPGWNQPPPEQKHAQERCLEKKGHQAFIGQQWRNYVRSRVSKATPIRAELERHDDAGHHAHAERNCKNPGPEAGYSKPNIPACHKIEALKHRDIRGKPDGERWQKDVPGNHPSPLQARQQHGIEGHRAKILAACEEHVP